MDIPTPRSQPSLEQKLENLPTKPGIYQFKDKIGEILYIGKAINLRNRIRQYFTRGKYTSARIKTMVSKIYDVEIIITDSEIEALILEATLIKKLKPHYNIDLKDDKSYPYIVITKEPFPRVFVTRRIIKDGSRYFGPFTDVNSMRRSLKMIRDIFKVRSCNYFISDETIENKNIKVCLDYHIKKCGGPCEGIVSWESYNEMIEQVARVLHGKTSTLIKEINYKMSLAAASLRYEHAAELRDRIRQLSVYGERQKVIDTEMADRDIFAIAIDGDGACGVVFNVREGKLIGKKHVYLSGVRGISEMEILEKYLVRYYLDNEDYPREIYLASELENPEVLQTWLSDKSNFKINIKVPKIGEKVKLLTLCKRNAEALLGEYNLVKRMRRDRIPASLSALKNYLRLGSVPKRIECFDISNIQGSDTVGSMVVFIDGKPRKSEYRKYKLQSIKTVDDFASMREIMTRRYRRLLEEQGERPDLIIVDGGKGQLSSAVSILEQFGLRNITAQTENISADRKYIPIIGLAKRLEEVFIPESSEPQNIPKSSAALKLLQQIRNEAHRFAVEYHRVVRRKRTLTTEIDLIQGVGKKKARELLEYFGSVQGIKFASPDQLSDLVGEKVATNIQQYINEEND